MKRKAWNKGLNKTTDIRVKNYSDTLSKIARPMSWSNEQRKEYAKNNGGYRENAGKSKKFKVLDSFGNHVCLQSSYELLCSEILNENNIKWIRPKALKYNNKNYFADFYLVDYDIYLDPKNNYKAKLDLEKINLVAQQNNVKVFILLDQHLNWNYLQKLLAVRGRPSEPIC